MKKTALFFILCFADIQNLQACPLCADVVARGKDVMQALRFGEGISWSIALMLGVPLALVLGMAFYLYRSSRKNAGKV